MSRPLALLAAVIGLLLVIAGVVYFIQPASGLPAFFPGHDAADTAHHFKHGIGAVILGLAAFAFAWFSSKPRRAS